MTVMTADEMGSVFKAGTPADFFENIMKTPDKAPPQFANMHGQIEKAAKSDNPNLKKWAEEMNAFIDNTAEGKALSQEQGNNPFGDMMGKFQDVMAAIKTSLADGFQMDDLGKIMQAFNQSADPVQMKAAEAQEHLDNANAYLRGAGEDGKTVTLNNEDVQGVAHKIQGLTL